MNQKVGRANTESKIQSIWLRGSQSDFLTLDISHSVWNWKQCISSRRPEAINRYMLRFTACDSSCASCFPDNPKCMSCVPGTALHHGKCISQCPTHNYLDAHGRCRGRQRHHLFGLVFATEKKKFSPFSVPSSFALFGPPACHSSCASCWGPSVSQCTLCPGGLLLHQGQCVEACGEGLYAQDHTCHSKSSFLSYLCFDLKSDLPCIHLGKLQTQDFSARTSI